MPEWRKYLLSSISTIEQTKFSDKLIRCLFTFKISSLTKKNLCLKDVESLIANKAINLIVLADI